jgi:hypothetical protein
MLPVFVLTLCAGPCLAATAQLQPNEINNVKVIKLQPGQSIGSLASSLRDDQFIEMPSGNKLSVAKLRAVQSAFVHAHQHAGAPKPEGFAILPAPKKAGVPIKPGETTAQILKRPDSDVVMFPSGRSASVAQIRKMAPWIQQHYGVNLTSASAGERPNLNGAAMKITSVADLAKIPKDTPASTVLESPKGTRITLGELRTAVANSKPKMLAPASKQGGAK